MQLLFRKEKIVYNRKDSKITDLEKPKTPLTLWYHLEYTSSMYIRMRICRITVRGEAEHGG